MALNKRQQLLQDYIVTCLSDNIFSFSDLANLNKTLPKLLEQISIDGREVIKELGQRGGSNGLRMISQFLMNFSERIK